MMEKIPMITDAGLEIFDKKYIRDEYEVALNERLSIEEARQACLDWVEHQFVIGGIANHKIDDLIKCFNNIIKSKRKS